MVLAAYIETPTEMFLAQPLYFTGTPWKATRADQNISRLWKSHKSRFSTRFQRGIGFPDSVKMLPFSVKEADTMIAQHDLLGDKAAKQIAAMWLQLSGVPLSDTADEVYMPEEVVSAVLSGSVLAALSGDTAVSEIAEGHNGNTLRRLNVYFPEIKRGTTASDRKSDLRDFVLDKWEVLFGGLGENEPVTRAIVSGFALSTFRFEPVAAVTARCKVAKIKQREPEIYTGTTAAGVHMNRHPLATEKGRKEMLNFVIRSRKEESGMSAEEALQDLHGRPDALKFGDFLAFLGWVGIKHETLLDVPNGMTERAAIEEIGENGNYDLFRDFLLAIHTRAKNGSLVPGAVIRSYPNHSDARKYLPAC